jgi:hypothetical protein
MLNNRFILSFYCFFLWFSFAFLVTPGYLTYRRHNLNLQAKINFAWSESFGIDARRRIQNSLGCCGYFNPYVEASISATCYARSVLPGCKAPYLAFEEGLLKKWYITVFSLVGFHVALIGAALLCANHVTYRFGKGMMPKAYRLTADAVAVIMDNYAAYVYSSFPCAAFPLCLAPLYDSLSPFTMRAKLTRRTDKSPTTTARTSPLRSSPRTRARRRRSISRTCTCRWTPWA